MSDLQRFCREAIAWKHLRHPNVLPLLGVTLVEQRFAMVSEWMEDGNINDFIQKNPNVDRTELVCALSEPYGFLTDVFSSLMSRRVSHICIASTSSMEI